MAERRQHLKFENEGHEVAFLPPDRAGELGKNLLPKPLRIAVMMHEFGDGLSCVRSFLRV